MADPLSQLSPGIRAGGVVILGMIASGIGMIVTSGAGPVILAGEGAALPNFNRYLSRVPHGLSAMLLLALLAAQAGAELYHQFIRRDGIFRRMWYGK